MTTQAAKAQRTERIGSKMDENPEHAKVRATVKRWRDKGYKIGVILIASAGEQMFKRFVMSFLAMFSGDAYNYVLANHKVKLFVDIVGDFPIDWNRNKGVQTAIHPDIFDADYVIQLDSDMTFQVDTIPKMIEAIESPLPDGTFPEIVSGMYFLKAPPFRPVLGRYIKWEKDLLEAEGFMKGAGLTCEGECGKPAHAKGTHQIVRYQAPHFWPNDRLFKVDVIGVGCVISRASMWRKLEQPYYKYVGDPIGGKDYNYAPRLSEDMAWCAQMHKKGIQVWIDPRIQCGHIGVLEANEEMHSGHLRAARDVNARLADDNPKKKEFNDAILDLR